MAERQHTGNPGNFAEDRAKAARAGHIGGQHSSGNFAHDHQRAVEAGRKGGLVGRAGSSKKGSASSGSAPQSSGSGGEAEPLAAKDRDPAQNATDFAHDRGRASATGRKGNHASH